MPEVTGPKPSDRGQISIARAASLVLEHVKSMPESESPVDLQTALNAAGVDTDACERSAEIAERCRVQLAAVQSGLAGGVVDGGSSLQDLMSTVSIIAECRRALAHGDRAKYARELVRAINTGGVAFFFPI